MKEITLTFANTHLLTGLNPHIKLDLAADICRGGIARNSGSSARVSIQTYCVGIGGDEGFWKGGVGVSGYRRESVGVDIGHITRSLGVS